MDVSNSSSASGYIFEGQDSDGLHTIHGVAIGSNDVTKGHLSGRRKLWIPQVLEDAADTLEGKQIVVDHANKESHKVVGQVESAGYKEGTGVIYEGVIDDEELAQKIGYDWLEVSPRIIHSEEMERRGSVRIPQKIHRFDNLSIVTKGASKSNSVDLGEHEELSEVLEEEGAVSEYQRHTVAEELQISEARMPEYDSSEETSWGDIPADTLSYWTDALDYDAEEVSDLTEDQKEEIAQHTLLGDPEADNVRELRFFPVVNARTGDVNRGALEAVRSGRGQSADIPNDTYESAYEMAGRLLNDEFGSDVEVEMAELADSEMKRVASQISSFTPMTKSEAQRLLNSMSPHGMDKVEPLVTLLSKSYGVEEQKARRGMRYAGLEMDMGDDDLSIDSLSELADVMLSMERFEGYDKEELMQTFEDFEEDSAEDDTPESESEDVEAELLREVLDG